MIYSTNPSSAFYYSDNSNCDDGCDEWEQERLSIVESAQEVMDKIAEKVGEKIKGAIEEAAKKPEANNEAELIGYVDEDNDAEFLDCSLQIVTNGSNTRGRKYQTVSEIWFDRKKNKLRVGLDNVLKELVKEELEELLKIGREYNDLIVAKEEGEAAYEAECQAEWDREESQTVEETDDIEI